MDSLIAERIIQKANNVFIAKDAPALIFLYDNMNDADNALSALNEMFGTDKIVLHIRYNMEKINITLISEDSATILNIDNLKLHSPDHFELIKPMANIFNGDDIMGRKFKHDLHFLTGELTQYGIKTSHLPNFENGFGRIEKFTTRLVE